MTSVKKCTVYTHVAYGILKGEHGLIQYLIEIKTKITCHIRTANVLKQRKIHEQIAVSSLFEHVIMHLYESN